MATGNAPRGFPRILQWLLAGLMLTIGLAVGILGAKLALVGGTLCFALMGVVIVIAAVLIFRNRRGGILLYTVAFIASVIWAISDAGWNYWPLFSRLLALGVLASLAAPVWSFLAGPPARKGPVYSVAAVLAVVLAVSFGWMFKSKPPVSTTEVVSVKPVAPGEQQKNWAYRGNTTHGNRFAVLDQINRQNVNQLQVAWVAHTGDIPQSSGSGAKDQNTLLQIGDTLYVCIPYSKVLVLDVDSGKEKWRYDSKSSSPSWQRCRGLSYYKESQAQTTPASDTQPAACSRRLFLPTIDVRLIAIDADTGKLYESFGDGGIVDLSVGMGEVKAGYYQQTSTLLIVGSVAVVGDRVANNYSTDEPPGVVRALDIHTGKLAWAWDPGGPALTGVPPKGQTYTRDTPNVWSAMSYDARLNLIYLPTGNITPDSFGGERTALDDKYSSSIVAVDATTDQVRWHFQTTHHDLWNFDLSFQSLSYDLPDGKGGITPVLVQTSKQGMIFMLNRETDEPVAKVEERPVPAGNVKGERYSPTQPYSVGMPIIGNQTLTESDMQEATLIDPLLCRIQFKEMRHQGVFTPPGEDRSLQFPGLLDGMNWGSVSVDPNNGLMFVNNMHLGLANYMVPRVKVAKDANGIEMGIVPMKGTPLGVTHERFLSPLGIPCQKPPLGTMSAVDLKTGKLVWQVPAGTVEDTGPLGIRMHMPIPIGMPTLGASLSTQSGLLFSAGTQDFYLHVFDTASGKEIWKSHLSTGSQSGPTTYVSSKTGKQYIIINAGDTRQSSDRGDHIIAYVLPDHHRSI